MHMKKRSVRKIDTIEKLAELIVDEFADVRAELATKASRDELHGGLDQLRQEMRDGFRAVRQEVAGRIDYETDKRRQIEVRVDRLERARR